MKRAYFLFGLGFAALSAMASPLAPKADAQFRGGSGHGGPEIILYSDTNFRGETRIYTGDVETLARDGFNDLARSVEVRGGAWTLCRDRAGQGRCRTIDRSVADLGQLGLDCELTSFYASGFNQARFGDRRFGDPRFGNQSGRGQRTRTKRNRRFGGPDRFGRNAAPVVLFTKDDFEGRSVGVYGPVNLRDLGFDDKADSIAIAQGSWIVCTRRDLRGDCDVLARSVYDLDDIDLDDKISSIAPYDGRRRF